MMPGHWMTLLSPPRCLLQPALGHGPHCSELSHLLFPATGDQAHLPTSPPIGAAGMAPAQQAVVVPPALCAAAPVLQGYTRQGAAGHKASQHTERGRKQRVCFAACTANCCNSNTGVRYMAGQVALRLGYPAGLWQYCCCMGDQSSHINSSSLTHTCMGQPSHDHSDVPGRCIPTLHPCNLKRILHTPVRCIACCGSHVAPGRRRRSVVDSRTPLTFQDSAKRPSMNAELALACAVGAGPDAMAAITAAWQGRKARHMHGVSIHCTSHTKLPCSDISDQPWCQGVAMPVPDSSKRPHAGAKQSCIAPRSQAEGREAAKPVGDVRGPAVNT